jgi:vacuolar protein sorting-associated protein 51
MDPLSPSTSTLSPAIAHVAETASSLAEELANSDQDHSTVDPSMQSQVRKVQWVLQTPQRLEQLFASGRRQEALDEWSKVQEILYRWNSPPGTDRLEISCQEVINSHTPETDDSDEET